MSRANILYLHPADIGRWVQPYGYPVRTPHLQQLAERGVTFRNAFATSPSCSPSRAALLTGQYPVQNGMLCLTHHGCLLRDYRRHLLHTLKAAGYFTLLAGHQHIHPRLSQFTEDGRELSPGQAIGFDLDWDKDDNNGDVRVREFLRGEHRTPFFIDCGFMQTHRPFPDPVPEDQPDRCRPPAHLPDTPAARRDMASFLRAANAVDVKIGYVLQALRDSGHADDTIVVATTDHGIDFPGMKTFCNDMGLGVMFILAGGPFTSGKVVDGLVSQLDVFPTLCEVLDIPKPDWLEGASLLALTRGETGEIHDAVFGELNFHGGYRPTRTIRTTRWRYVHNWYSYAKRGDLAVAPEELYDLSADPLEQRNLAGRPALARVQAELAGKLRAWMQRVHDPLLTGKIDPPATYVEKYGGSRAEREAVLSRCFARPGHYVTEWTPDPYVSPRPRKEIGAI